MLVRLTNYSLAIQSVSPWWTRKDAAEIVGVAHGLWVDCVF